MSELSNLRAPPGANTKKKRVGRGESSGWGKTSGSGQNGQKSRRGGGKPKRGFEGGQMPLARRLPKRGFVSRNRVEYTIVNVSSLDVFDENTVVDAGALLARGMIKKGGDGLKVLAEGELSIPLTVRAAKFSKAAVEKIEAAGGRAEVV